MPYKLELTWIAHAKRWRKRYLGRTYYMKTNVGGRKDREGYLAALDEWQRLKAFLDGLGPNPYTETGVLVPAGRELELVARHAETRVQSIEHRNWQNYEPALEPARLPDDPPWILGRGIAAFLRPDLVVSNPAPVQLPEERRVSALTERYLSHRRAEAERGDLSLKQYDEDKRQVDTFTAFLNVNYPTLAFIDQISPDVLNVYRDKQTELCGSKVTLKKRLEGVRKFLAWLIDRNILKELPKDMSSYAKVRLEKPRPAFFTVDEIQLILAKSPPMLKACVLLGLNAGFTQKDCSTLTAAMIDWDSGILARDRNKTGCDQRAKLWPETIKAIRGVGRINDPGPIFLNSAGKPLVSETVNPKNGKLVTVDSVRLAWDRQLDLSLSGKSFKTCRKTSADHIEKWNPSLTGLFLAHSESGVKRHYVGRHFDELFAATDKLREIY